MESSGMERQGNIGRGPTVPWGQAKAWPLIMKVKVAQSCLTLYDPVDYTVHGILQARILEWGAFPVSRGSSQPKD